MLTVENDLHLNQFRALFHDRHYLENLRKNKKKTKKKKTKKDLESVYEYDGVYECVHVYARLCVFEGLHAGFWDRARVR